MKRETGLLDVRMFQSLKNYIIIAKCFIYFPQNIQKITLFPAATAVEWDGGKVSYLSRSTLNPSKIWNEHICFYSIYLLFINLLISKNYCHHNYFMFGIYKGSKTEHLLENIYSNNALVFKVRWFHIGAFPVENIFKS